MEIIYCSKCGKMIPPGGLDEGKRYLVAGEPVCPKCYQRTPEEEHTGKTLLLTEGAVPKPAAQEEEAFDAASLLPRPRASRLDMFPSGPEEAPARPGVSWLLWTGTAVLLPVLVLGSLVAWWLLRGTGPDQAGRRQPFIPVVEPPPAVAPPPRDRPPPSGADDEQKLRTAQDEAEDHRRKRPQDFAGAIARFEDLKRTAPGTKWAKDADAAIAEITAERDRAVDDQITALKARADALAQAGDLDGATEVFAKPSGALTEQLRPRFEAERARLAALADERLAVIQAAVEKCSKEGRPEQGLQELDEAAAVKCRAWAAPLRKLRARLEAEKADAAATAEKKLKADADRKLGEILDEFERRVLAGNCSEAAEFLSAEKRSADAEQLRLIAGNLGAAEQLGGLLKAEELRRRAELAKLPGRTIELTLNSGKKVSGKVLSATGTELSLEVKHLAGPAEIVRTDKVAFRDLPRWQQEQLVAPAKPSGPDDQLAAAAMAMAVNDLAGAEQALAAAGAHQLAPRWSRRLDVLRFGEGEAAAKRAWDGSVAGLVRGKYSEADGQALTAALEPFLKAHGGSAFAKSRAVEIEELRLIGRVRELFRGRVKQFDPKTLEAELLWDFADPGQILDFEPSGGQWRIEGGGLRGETKAKDDRQATWTRAAFAPGVRASCAGTILDDRSMALALGVPRDYVALVAFLVSMDGKTAKTVGLEGRGASWDAKGTSMAARPEPGLAGKKRCLLELSLDQTASSGKVDSGPPLSGRGADYKSVRAGLRVFPSTDRNTVAVFNDLGVSGRLDRAWLEAALLKAQPRPGATLGPLAHWTLDKLDGQSVPDASGRGHGGKPSGTVKPAAGRLGGALRFGGQESWVEVPNAPELEVGKDNADFSVCFWLYPEKQTAPDQYLGLAHKGADQDQRTFALWLSPNSSRIYYRIGTKDNPNDGGESAAEVPPAKWTHVAYVKRENNLILYLGGKPDSSAQLGGEVVPNSGPVRIGGCAGHVSAECRLDDLRIYGRALTDRELADLAAGREPGGK